jgi:hypothetical protein
MRTSRRPWAATTLAALATFSMAPAHAQVRASPAGPVVVVVDALTLAPVPGAQLVVRGVGTFHANGAGRIALPAGVAGDLALTIASLGYVSQDAVRSARPGEPITIELAPDPARLEQIEVVVDRLEYRRARHFNPIRVMDSRELANLGPGGIEAHVRALAGGLGPCTAVSGGCNGDPAVAFIDDWAFPFRLAEVDAFAPADLYALEVYPRESIVRLYTRDFIERAADNPRLVRLHLPPPAGTGLVTAGAEPTFAGVLRARLPGF